MAKEVNTFEKDLPEFGSEEKGFAKLNFTSGGVAN